MGTAPTAEPRSTWEGTRWTCSKAPRVSVLTYDQSSEKARLGDRRPPGSSVSPWCPGPEPKPPGHLDQVGERVGSHLAHHLAAVRLHRNLADVQFSGDLFVQQSGDDQSHDLALPGAEALLAVAEDSHLRLMIEGGAAALDGARNGVHQRIVAEGLGQELH